MKVIVVDEKDQVVGYKERNDRNEKDIIRVTGLWIFNSQKEILIAQRSFNKTHGPGKWGPSAAGTVEEGETYASNIVKEASEELGVTISEKDLVPGPHVLRSTSHRYFAQHYIVRLDLSLKSLVIQKEEVETARWISTKDLLKWLEREPDDFLPSFKESLQGAIDALPRD